MDAAVLSVLLNPVVLGVVGTAAMSMLVGLRVGRRQGRTAAEAEIRANPTALEQENMDLKQANENLRINSSSLKQETASFKRELEIRTKERDQYRAMAATHEVKLPEIKVSKAEKKQVWKARRFANHPSKNLEHMAAELADYAGLDIEMEVKISGSGQFWRQGEFLKRVWHTTDYHGRKTPISDLGPWVFHGKVEHALDDLRAILMDDNTGLMARLGDEPRAKKKKGKVDAEPVEVFVGEEPEKVWLDADSPILFEVTLHVYEKPQVIKPPEIQIVQVPVVETVVEREVIEKPVVISVPKGQEADLCGHTREEIQALVRTELEMRDLDQPPEKRLQEHARRAAAATKLRQGA